LSDVRALQIKVQTDSLYLVMAKVLTKRDLYRPKALLDRPYIP